MSVRITDNSTDQITEVGFDYDAEVADWPELTPEARDQLALLLRQAPTDPTAWKRHASAARAAHRARAYWRK